MNSRPPILAIKDPAALQLAASLVSSGELIAFPTDTVYGIGACAFVPEAVDRIYQVKGRSHNKAIPILLADPEDLDRITPPLSLTAARLVQAFWPGPLTLVVPLLPSLPENLSPGPTIGVRIPDHDWTRALLRAAGPLAATSANLSGEPPATTAAEVLDQLGKRVSLILEDGTSPGGLPSTVLDCTGEEPALLREGPLSWNLIVEVLSQDS